MAVPTDFSSFVGGWNLNSSSYSGGAGGTFTNIVSGAPVATVTSATPSFSTESGIEGMGFSASSTEIPTVDIPSPWEICCVAISRPGTTGALIQFGGTLSSTNTWGFAFNAGRPYVFCPLAVTTYPTAGTDYTTTPYVYSWSICPEVGRTYAQVNDGTAVSHQASSGSFAQARPNWGKCGIGNHRTNYFNGWIARVLFFSRALHYRDPSGLASLIATEMASIGL